MTVTIVLGLQLGNQMLCISSGSSKDGIGGKIIFSSSGWTLMDLNFGGGISMICARSEEVHRFFGLPSPNTPFERRFIDLGGDTGG